MTVDPRDEYQRRLDAREAEVVRLGAIDRRFSLTRLGVFLVFVVCAWLAWGPTSAPAVLVAIPVVAFLALMILHERVIVRLRRAQRGARLYQRALARLDGDWAGKSSARESGERFADAHHPFAADLDLFGRGSLFELLNATRTRAGEDRLASWLLEPAAAGVLRARHGAVAELAPRVDFAEDLQLLGEDVSAEIDPTGLGAWGAAPPIALPPWITVAAPLLAALTLVAFGAWLTGHGAAAFAALVLIEIGLGGAFARRVAAIVHGVDRPSRDLGILVALVSRVAGEAVDAPLLRELRARLGADPVAAIAKLHRLVALLESRHNQFFLPLSWLLLWTTQCAAAIERWRRRHGAALPGWLEAIAEIEALVSLGRHHFEHPGDVFPELADGAATLVAEGIAHPLLPESRAVRNDVRLDADHRLLLISGSNMSGKSTLLRSVGTNVVLALAGGVVRARRLSLGPLAIGASIRVNDSLLEGASRFYAEIQRLRQIVELAHGARPLLFLLDEILHGTNSHDRRIGAAAVIKGLIGRGGIGLVTTHDLALAKIADELAPRARNVHFEDHLEGDKMVFDYALKDGVVTRSNALDLMRSIGLDV